MKISKVELNNRRKAFEVHTRSQMYSFPYASVRPSASNGNKVADLFVDPELGREAFVYVLESGEEGTVHIDHVLEYNKDPSYMSDLLMHKLSLGAKQAAEQSPLGVREIARRLRTSPAQYYRLIDQTNYKKSMQQLLQLLCILDCEIELNFRNETRSTMSPKKDC